MEAYLPRWFRNARYQDSILKLGKLGTLSNPKPSPLVVAELRVRLKLDFEFYEFVKQRLERQRKEIQNRIFYLISDLNMRMIQYIIDTFYC